MDRHIGFSDPVNNFTMPCVQWSQEVTYVPGRVLSRMGVGTHCNGCNLVYIGWLLLISMGAIESKTRQWQEPRYLPEFR